MGVDTNVNLGPFMTVKGKTEIDVEDTVTTCSNEHCETHKSNTEISKKFCGECGAPAIEKKYTYTETVTPRDLFYSEKYEEDFENELCWTDPMNCDEESGVFVPNERSPSEKQLGFSGDEGFILDFSNLDFKKDIIWFNETFKKQIDIFKKEFGDDSVEIKCGMVQWYS